MPALQLDAPGQSPWGSVRSDASMQTPSIPPVLAEEHAVHLSVQALPQQTPSTQNPVAHSSPPAHAPPADFFATQAP
jgi:hypothetical protein